jgi:hypothetical protein
MLKAHDLILSLRLVGLDGLHVGFKADNEDNSIQKIVVLYVSVSELLPSTRRK